MFFLMSTNKKSVEAGVKPEKEVRGGIDLSYQLGSSNGLDEFESCSLCLIASS